MENTTPYARTDHVTAARVERGLKIQAAASTQAAAAYLELRGVPLHVAVRVLTTPHRRAISDEAPPAPARSWRDIVGASGLTFGWPLEGRPKA